MILHEMKMIIKYVIELDIDQLETFKGYRGDSVLKITLTNSDTRDKIDKFLKNLSLPYKNDIDITKRYGGAYNIYVGIENSDIYQLKD